MQLNPWALLAAEQAIDDLDQHYETTTHFKTCYAEDIITAYLRGLPTMPHQLADQLRVVRTALAAEGSPALSEALKALDAAIERALQPDRYEVQLVHLEDGRIAGRYAPEHVGGETLHACSLFLLHNGPMLQATGLRIARVEA